MKESFLWNDVAALFNILETTIAQACLHRPYYRIMGLTGNPSLMLTFWGHAQQVYMYGPLLCWIASPMLRIFSGMVSSPTNTDTVWWDGWRKLGLSLLRWSDSEESGICTWQMAPYFPKYHFKSVRSHHAKLARLLRQHSPVVRFPG